MPLNPTTMINALKEFEADTESAAAEAWTDMIINYLKEATGILPTGFTPAIRDSIIAILDPTPEENDGISVAGLAAIPAAFTAVWAAMVAAPVTFFATATAITPPPALATIAADLAAAAPINVALDGGGIPPSTGTLEGDKELAITVLVSGAPLAPGTGFHLRNQGGTWVPPSGPPVVIL